MDLLWAFIESIEPMEWLTIGLLVFAGVQVLVPLWSEKARLGERKADEQARKLARDREEDLLFQIAWAEHFRLDQLSSQWEKADLVELAALKVLEPDDVLPKDWSMLMGALARLSVEAGFLGGVALTLGHDVARHIAILRGIVNGYAVQYPQKSPNEIVQMARQNQTAIVTEMEAAIKNGSKELALLMWDAARQWSRADEVRNLNFRNDATSAFGRSAVQALSTRAQTASTGVKAIPASSQGPKT